MSKSPGTVEKSFGRDGARPSICPIPNDSKIWRATLRRGRSEFIYFSTPSRSGILLVLLAFFMSFPLGLRADLRFTRKTDLPSSGLQLKLMPNALEKPLPSPTAYNYTRTHPDGTTEKMEMYAPIELWQNAHHAGMWEDKDGNTLRLTAVRYPLPKFNSAHVRRADYEKAVGQAAPKTDWTPESLCAWVADTTGSRKVTFKPVPGRSFGLQSLIQFQMDPVRENRLAYAFRLNRSAVGQRNATDAWFFVLFELAPSTSRDKAVQAIRETFFSSIATLSASSSSRAGTSATSQDTEEDTPSDEFSASRQQALASISNMKDWWSAETKNYIFLSNLGRSGQTMVRKLQENIEIMRAAFEQVIPPTREITSVAVVRVFGTPGEYEAYVGPDLAWSGGLWMSSRKELIIKPPPTTQKAELAEGLNRVIYHEALHQYLFYATGQADVSVWFNEGHAVFFENTDISPSRLTVNESDRYALLVEEMIRTGKLQLHNFLRMSYEEFYDPQDSARTKNYALAWALVYFLRQAAPLDNPPKYADIPGLYLQALQENKTGIQATEAAFKNVSLEAFEKDFASFWTSRNKRSSARRNRIFKDYRPSSGR